MLWDVNPSASQSAEELFMLYESERRGLADEFALGARDARPPTTVVAMVRR